MLGAAITGKLRERPVTPYSSDGEDSCGSSPTRVRRRRRDHENRRTYVRKYRSDLSNQSILSQEPMAPPSSVYVADIPRDRFTHNDGTGWADNDAGFSQEGIPITEKTDSGVSLDVPKARGINSRIVKESGSPIARGSQTAKGMIQEVPGTEHNASQVAHRGLSVPEEESRIASHLSTDQKPTTIPEHVASNVAAQSNLREQSPSLPKRPSPPESRPRKENASYRNPSVHNESSDVTARHDVPRQRAPESGITPKPESTTPAVETMFETPPPPKPTQSPREHDGSGEKLSPFPDLPESSDWNFDDHHSGAEAASPVGSAFESLWESQASQSTINRNHGLYTQPAGDDGF